MKNRIALAVVALSLISLAAGHYLTASASPRPAPPSGIPALANMESHAIAPVAHIAQMVEHSARARAYLAAHR